MAFREVAMWEVLNILRRLHRDEHQASIARATGHSRSTIRRYARVARELGWSRDGAEPGEALAAAIRQRVHPAAARGAGDAELLLEPHAAQIRTWLEPPPRERRGLRLTKVHQLLERNGVSVPYSSLHRFAVKHCGFGATRRVTVRMADTVPGEAAEIDFGRLGRVWDPDTERLRLAWALVVVLIHSRHQYVHVTYSQRVGDVISGLEDAWVFFGGVVQRLVVDNFASAVTKADRYDPIFQRTFEEYAQYRGFLIDAAPVRQPTGKPHVERGVPYVRESFFRGETWRDLAHVQRAAIGWCRDTAGTRVHGTTQQRPLAVFENVERAALLPLEKARFDPPLWAQCTVHPDHHLSVGKALYSVPTRFIGKKVWVRRDTQLVRIYADSTLIKTHAVQAPGGRATDHEDYPEVLTAYTLRDPARIIRQAEARGAAVGTFAAALLAGPFPWAKLRQAQRLLRLGEKFGWDRVNAACQRALAFDLLNVRRLETIVRADVRADLELAPAPVGGDPGVRVIPLRPRFARADSSFTHPPSTPLVPSAPAPHPQMALPIQETHDA
jgi:transposase